MSVTKAIRYKFEPLIKKYEITEDDLNDIDFAQYSLVECSMCRNAYKFVSKHHRGSSVRGDQFCGDCSPKRALMKRYSSNVERPGSAERERMMNDKTTRMGSGAGPQNNWGKGWPRSK